MLDDQLHNIKDTSKHIVFSNFLNKLEDYEKKQGLWFTELIASGRKILKTISNSVDKEHLINLTDSFVGFLSLLTQCHSNASSNEENILTPSDKTSKRNESQDLLPKNDIVEMVNNDLQCPICNEWLYRATSANCNHTFCETCIKKWLTINNTCPVCRTSIEHTSTSIAVDSFISNLCQLFGGFIKERRESIQNARIDIINIDHNNADTTFDEETTNNLNQSIENDTYISQLDSILEHSNLALLRPLTQPVQNPISNVNSRQPIVNLITPHPNTVQLLSSPQSSTVSGSLPSNRSQPTSSTSRINQRFNRLQPTSVNRHANRPNLQPTPVVSLLADRLRPTTVISPRANYLINGHVVGPYINRPQPVISPSVIRPQINRFRTTSSSPVTMSRTNRPQPTSSPSMGRSNIFRQPPTSSTSVTRPGLNLNIGFILPRNNRNIRNY